MIYSKRIRGEWLTAFIEYESLTGFEPMCQDRIDSGEMTVREVFQHNLNWFETVAGEVSNIKTP